MRAHQARRHALIFGCLLGTCPAFADDAVPKPAPDAKAAPKAEAPPAPIIPATPAEANRELRGTEARLRAIDQKDRDKPANKPIVEILDRRQALLLKWLEVHKERDEAEHPKTTPEQEAAEFKTELDKTRALLDESAKKPDALLPEAFQAKDADAKPSDARLGEMKEAIGAARDELKELAAGLESLRTEGSRGLAATVAGLRGDRDKAFQTVAALGAQKAERQAGLANASSAEARDLARERLVNFDWEARIEVERLATVEARIALATKRLDLGTLTIQAKAARVQLAKRLAERMESKYDALAERQRSALKREVVKEETRAATSNDPLERRRSQRTAELFELESQVVAYDKAYATSTGVSLQQQTALADAAVTNFAELRKLLDDGNVSPLDVLRLKNDFRRIAPERAQVVRTDLAAAEAELTTYENALTDAEIDLVNDSRDDRFDRESLLEQLPPGRRVEANAMLEDLETRHKGLLNRRRGVLQKLAGRAEDVHNRVLNRIATLDAQYAFIRTHIFWIRDAEPLTTATIAHTRDDAIRTAKAAFRLAVETGDRSLWGRTSPEFVLVLAGLVILPWPLLIGQKALDRLRMANVPEGALGLADFSPEGIEG